MRGVLPALLSLLPCVPCLLHQCRERMMTVLEDSASPGADAAAARQPGARAWQHFSVVEASSLEQLAQHLAATHPHWGSQQQIMQLL